MTLSFTDKEVEQEPEFPGTEAVPTDNALLANGWNIDYLDNVIEPRSAFIPYRSWDAAKVVFERTTHHTVIVAQHRAKMDFF